jgi:hypothetical protein
MAAFVMLMAGTVLDAGQKPPPADLQTPTFKVQVDYVEVDAVVMDANGKFVSNLKAEGCPRDRRLVTASLFSAGCNLQ